MKRRGIMVAAVAGVTFAPASVFPLDPPKSPILVLETPANFGAYTGEILRAEGFNDFQVASPLDTDLTAEYLSHFDVVILTETKLNRAQAELFALYVRTGGNLIAFRPDPGLATIFGISLTGATITGGYIKIDSQNDLGKGLTSEPLQFHGPADEYELKGGAPIATLGRDVTAATDNPAIVSLGLGEGQLVAFAYNLPKNIVLTRQGNPQAAGKEKDGIRGIRAADMFAEGWLNPLKNLVNQADEQMRLLTRAIERLNIKRPLPRLWYLPGRNRSLVMLSGDGEDSPEKDFDYQLGDIKSRGVRMTLYLKGTYVRRTKVKTWIDDGFEVAAHVDDTNEAVQPTWNEMESKTRSTMEAFKNAYGIEPRTVRNHWVVWCGTDPDGKADFTAQASIEAKSGIQLDCNFYHWDPQSSPEHFLGPIGNFNGSGLPMKFINEAGEILNIYQSITQLPDEEWGAGNLFGNFKVLLDRSLDHEGYTFINVNLHTDRWLKWSRKEGLEIIDYANRRGVPMWTAERTLRFLQRRNAVSFQNMNWSNNELSFGVQVPDGTDELTLIVPRAFNSKLLNAVSLDGKTAPSPLQRVKGNDYAMIALASGDHYLVAKYREQP